MKKCFFKTLFSNKQMYYNKELKNIDNFELYSRNKKKKKLLLFFYTYHQKYPVKPVKTVILNMVRNTYSRKIYKIKNKYI